MTEKVINKSIDGRKRTKVLVLNNRNVGNKKKEKISNNDMLKKYRKEVDQIVKTEMKKNPAIVFEVTYNRKKGEYDQNELEVNISANVNSDLYNNHISLKKRREQESIERRKRLKEIYLKTVNQVDLNMKKDVLEWKEQMVRVGTGFRVRKDDKNPQRRRFDVGYADVKPYKRKENREVTIDASNINRTIVGKGKDARVKVINAVCDIEKRRPVSKYTGSGILRKSMVGKLKLKSTKSGGKD